MINLVPSWFLYQVHILGIVIEFTASSVALTLILVLLGITYRTMQNERDQ